MSNDKPTKIGFGALQEMANGYRKYPVDRLGLLQLIEGCEREKSKLIDERKNVNHSLKLLRKNIDDALDELDNIEAGGNLFEGPGDEPSSGVTVSIDDWRETVNRDMKPKKDQESGDETFSPDDEVEDEDEEADA